MNYDLVRILVQSEFRSSDRQTDGQTESDAICTGGLKNHQSATSNSTDMWAKLKKMGAKSDNDVALGLKDLYNHFSKPAVENNENIHNFNLLFENEILQLMETYRAKSEEYVHPHSENSQLITEILNSAITEDKHQFKSQPSMNELHWA